MEKAVITLSALMILTGSLLLQKSLYGDIMEQNLTERIKEALNQHIPTSNATQWYIDENSIDCDSDEFRSVIEKVLKQEKDQIIKATVAWITRPYTDPSPFGPCKLYPGRDCPGCENLCARVDRIIEDDS